MKIEFLGDSITEGYGAPTVNDCFVSLIAKDLNIQTINHGIGGTRIARQINGDPEHNPHDIDFNMRVKDLDPTADYIFVFGGTNDFGHGDAPIGNINDNTVYTFYGALKILIKSLLKIYKKEQIRFILPFHRWNEDDPCGDVNKTQYPATLKEYIEAEENVFKLFDITYLCLDDIFPKPKGQMGEELCLDGLHPNKKGYRVIADYLENYIKENLM